MCKLVEDGHVRPIRRLAGSTIDLQGAKFTLTNNPILRLVEAVRIVFPEPMEGFAASMRFFFLADTLDKPEVGPLVQTIDGQLNIHDSLVRAMAQVDVDEEGYYDIEKLVELAKDHLMAAMRAEEA
jgi:hypothetical protein